MPSLAATARAPYHGAAGGCSGTAPRRRRKREMATELDRREMLRYGGAAALTGGVLRVAQDAEAAKPEATPGAPLRIALIGVGGRGRINAKAFLGEDVVALCDVDQTSFAPLVEAHPELAGARRVADWRELVADDGIEAFVVSTADHTHAPCTLAALRAGKHVYCEKPLAHSVREVRAVRELSRRARVATQMGTQIHAGENYRRCVELVRSGVIGPVREAHVWCSRTIEPLTPLAGTHEVPPHLAWDLWLGPAPARPFHPDYLPGNLNWNRRWDFGNGVLGDMGSHLIDLPFWALDLSAPTSVRAEGPDPDPVAAPPWLTVTWSHAPRSWNPNLDCELALRWYHGGEHARPPLDVGVELKDWTNGILFVGDDGFLLADYRRRVLLPEERFAGRELPDPLLPPSVGHHREWILAAKTGAPTSCPFDAAGALIEHNLLGNVAFRLGLTLAWDAERCAVRDLPEAEPYLARTYREGWIL